MKQEIVLSGCIIFVILKNDFSSNSFRTFSIMIQIIQYYLFVIILVYLTIDHYWGISVINRLNELKNEIEELKKNMRP